jgi:aryl-alcohol dehydrogenase-like predicted oxidoreductase
VIENIDKIILGNSDIAISPLGIGAWAWGDRSVWGYGQDYGETDIREAFEASLEAGINFFDTAELYGLGRSERLLGKFIHESGAQVIVASKFMPFPWRLSKERLANALRTSLQRLGMERVDLYQIHFPLPPRPVEIWADALADAHDQGLVRAVGVSNYDEEKMRRTQLRLRKRGVPLTSNQVEYSLLNRRVEFNHLLRACHDEGITLIAYSPLEQGLLTGKYTPENPPPGARGREYNRSRLEEIQPLIHLMREIGHQHEEKTPAQVALNWLICKGTLPIPGAKNARQAIENAQALGWRLTQEEMDALDEISARLSK